MSDIFLSAGIAVDVDVVKERLRWTSSTHFFGECVDGLNWLVARVDNDELWAPAWDSASRTRVLLAGRFAFDESEWLHAERLPYIGGLAARLILERWLKAGPREIEQLNGAGMAVVIDEAQREVHLWTDRMGFYPAFATESSGFIVCSHPDVAADVLSRAQRPCTFDTVTMAEFLRTGTATQPHTYWREIRQLEAGTKYRFAWNGTAGLKESRQYWRPPYFDQPYLTDRREIVDRLTNALSSAVRKRTLPRLGNVALLLSSGADSRAALFGACEPSRVKCFTFFDEPNAELRGASALAAVAGSEHFTYRRTRDYYFEHAEEAVRVSGGMWSIDSAHYGGVAKLINSTSPGVVLTGCYADYLMKGLAYNRVNRTLFGRSIPLYAFADFSHQFYLPFATVMQPWHDLVHQRLHDRYAPLLAANCDAISGAEHLRLSPIVREGDAAGRNTLRRFFPHDVFMADNEIVDLAGLISPDQKLNGIPFGMAVSRIAGSLGRNILNNNYSAPVGAPELERLVWFVHASVMRKLRRQGGGQPFEKDPTSVATVGSWPYMPRVIAHSERVKVWWSSLPKDQAEFLFDILGPDRRTWSIQDWADRDSFLFMRFFTASVWMSLNPSALATIRAS